MNTLFEPSHSPAHSIQPQTILPSLPSAPSLPPSFPPSPSSTVFLPQPTYDFRPPNFYPNLYTDPHHHQPYPVYPPILITEQHKLPQNETSNEKVHKWWSFHNIKEKVKSFFKHRQNSKDETQNPMPLLENQQQLWPGKQYIFIKLKWKMKSIGIDCYFEYYFFVIQLVFFLISELS